jgi:hypothetical protein
MESKAMEPTTRSEDSGACRVIGEACGHIGCSVMGILPE